MIKKVYRKRHFIISLLILLICLLSKEIVSSQTCLSKWNIGYLPTYQQSGNGDIYFMEASDFTHLTHIAHVGPYVKTDGSFDMNANSVSTTKLAQGVIQAHAHNVPILICIQGWYNVYLPAIQNPVSRANLINNTLSLFDTYGYDGVDVDLEPIMSPYVSGIQTGNPDFVEFINTLYDSLQIRTSTFLGTQPLLTVAANGYAGPVLATLQPKFDMINIMTYDLAAPYPGWETWHDSPVYDGGNVLYSTGQPMPSVENELNMCINAGVAKSKLGVGIIFDAYRWKGGSGTSTGGVTEPMQQYSSDPSWTRFSFGEMMQNYFDQTKYRYDIDAQMSFMSKNMPNNADDEFWSFNDRLSCIAKVDYVYQNDLGGTMIWELKGSYIPSNPSGQRLPQLNYINEGHCLNNSEIQTCVGSSGDVGFVGDKNVWKIIDDINNPVDGSSYNSVVNGITVSHNQPSQVNMGSVNYTYSYTDRFITIGEYLDFLNDVDPDNSLNFEGDLVIKGFIQYTAGNWIANTFNSCSSGQNINVEDVKKLPVSSISYNQAARFANWSATRDPGFGAYTFASSDGNAIVTAINSSWNGVRLSTENEFYKAAYWDKTDQKYNIFGTTSLDLNNVPVSSIANSEGVIYPSEGHLYNMTSNTQAGSPCYWQNVVGLGGMSAFGIHNMVGGLQHFLTPDNPVFPLTSIVLRPDKQNTGGEAGQRSSFETSISPSEFCTSCSFSLVMSDNVCQLNCLMTNTGIDNIQCNDNGTSVNSIDDFIEFTLNPAGNDVGAAYIVSANNGGIVSPAYGIYGSQTVFHLQSGSANGFTYTITIKDVRDASCFLTTTVSANPCSNQSISKCIGPYGGNGGIGEGAMWSVIGDAGNPADGPTYSSIVNGSTIIHNNTNQIGYGSVNYVYSVYDRFVRIGDFIQYLNAVDPSNTKNYEGRLALEGLIEYSGGQWVTKNYNYTSFCGTGQQIAAADVAKLAVTWVSLNQMAHYCNWLSSGDPDVGVYSFVTTDGNSNISSINSSYSGIRLMTENEYYKAAYWNQASDTYGIFGTTNLNANGIPVQTTVSSNGYLANSFGHPYGLSLFWNFNTGNPCLWQFLSGQGGQSPNGVYNNVGGFHNWLIPNNPGFPMTTSVMRPQNQVQGTYTDQMSSWRAEYSPDQQYSSPTFQLAYTGDACSNIPLKLISFTGNKEKDHNFLHWETVNEIEVDKFIVQKSIDSENWQSIAEVKCKSEDPLSKQIYEMKDNDSETSYYYRLKILDKNGKFEFSDVIFINRKTENLIIENIVPNPTNGNFSISYNSTKTDKTLLRIVSSIGEIIYQKETISQPGVNHNFIELEDISSGLYLLTLKQGDEIDSLKFVIEH